MEIEEWDEAEHQIFCTIFYLSIFMVNGKFFNQCINSKVVSSRALQFLGNVLFSWKKTKHRVIEGNANKLATIFDAKKLESCSNDLCS